MQVTLISHTINPQLLVASAARLCYSNSTISELVDNLSDEKNEEFVQMLSTIGHESPIEHCSFTFGIEGVSRALLAQITRHRIASFSVQSQRYVELKTPQYVTPPEIVNSDVAELYNEAILSAFDSYNKLCDILKKKHLAEFLSEGYRDNEANKLAEKKAIEDARFVLPNACETKMIVTMNARSLLNFFKVRCCNRAQWEIKAVADEMLKLVYKVAPAIFAKAGPSCFSNVCIEGKMSCGKAIQVKREYQSYRE